jgi:hypothetical protein
LAASSGQRAVKSKTGALPIVRSYLPTANCQLPTFLSNSFAVYSAKGCKQSALFDQRGAGAGEALLIYRGGCVDFYGL